MKLLLDTHIWIWSQLEPKKVRPRTIKTLTEASEIWFSPITTWEILTLCRKKKLALDMDPATWFAAARASAGAREAPITEAVVAATTLVSLAHDDPADRFLAATARVYDLTLVTSDDKLLRGTGFRIFEN